MNYTFDEADFLSHIYNLILDVYTYEEERNIYVQAKNLIEIDKESYESVIFQITPILAELGKVNQLSIKGIDFLMNLTTFTPSSGLGFLLFKKLLIKR